MSPTETGHATRCAPLVDTLHTIRLPRLHHDAHYLHRLVEAATPDGIRTLWACPAPRTLVVRAPHLDETALPTGAHLSTTTRPIPDDDARVEWALIANPIHNTPTHQGTRGTRTPLRAPDVPAWAVRKLAPALADTTVTACERLPALAGHHPRTGRTITHTRYATTGTATTRDQTLLAHLIAAGIGPGKAFGCGLLTVGAR